MARDGTSGCPNQPDVRNGSTGGCRPRNYRREVTTTSVRNTFMRHPTPASQPVPGQTTRPVGYGRCDTDVAVMEPAVKRKGYVHHDVDIGRTIE